MFQPAFSNPLLDSLSDAAIFDAPAGRLAMTGDSFVVQPLRFPGGSIGELAVNGTVNDLAVSGARPMAMTATSCSKPACRRRLSAGSDSDGRGRAGGRSADRRRRYESRRARQGRRNVYLHHRPGRVDPHADLGPQRIRAGDRVILSGPIGNHGMAIMLARAELEIEADIQSDTRPLCELTARLLDSVGRGVHWMRDATRGGVATVLNELSRDAEVRITISEESVPVDDASAAPANCWASTRCTSPTKANSSPSSPPTKPKPHSTSCGTRRAASGPAFSAKSRRTECSCVVARSAFGGTRVVDMLIGDPLPRICYRSMGAMPTALRRTTPAASALPLTALTIA